MNDLVESALAPEGELPFDAVGQDEERDGLVAEALEKERVAEPFDDGRSLGQDGIVGIVFRHQTEVDVRVRIRLARGDGSLEKCGDDAPVGGTHLHKAREDGVMLC